MAALRDGRASRNRGVATLLIAVSVLVFVGAIVLALAPSIGLLQWGVFYGGNANSSLQSLRYLTCFASPVVSAALLYIGINRWITAHKPPASMWRFGSGQVELGAVCILIGLAGFGVMYFLLAMAGSAG